MFQYQLGSIGAVLAPPAKLRPLLVSIPAWFDWRRLAGLLQLPPFICFNTSLVRLARGPRAPRGCGGSVSIPAWFDWRIHLLFGLGDHHQVSIPAWFDWREAKALRRIADHLVSIPAWFDWRLHPPGVAHRGPRFSIPAWFDWRPGRPPGRAAGSAAFQYQLGSIGATQRPTAPSTSRPFSIPAWFDWRYTTWAKAPTRAPFSIPAWFDWRLVGFSGISNTSVIFNTSLVRLAQVFPALPDESQRVFNTSLVRLAPTSMGSASVYLAIFNTSLVRLAPPRRLGAILHVAQIRLGTFPPAARGYVTVDPR